MSALNIFVCLAASRQEPTLACCPEADTGTPLIGVSSKLQTAAVLAKASAVASPLP